MAKGISENRDPGHATLVGPGKPGKPGHPYRDPTKTENRNPSWTLQKP